MAYSLINSYAGEALLSGFNWFNGVDPTFGFVAYQSRDGAQSMGLYSIDEGTGVVRLGVDHANEYALDQGRPSIRLESKESYNQGLFIADFLHMPPSKCGLWPAFWAYGGDWPNNGEIDIIEGVNTNTKNTMSAHTRFGCTQVPVSPLSRFSGQQRNAECAAGTDNVGCGFEPPSSDAFSYGDGFNAAQGGVYAMKWDSESISLWHFARGDIPSDIEEKKPNPETWGMPQAVFGGPNCAVDSFWKNMNIVINIDFCGAWGGNVWGKVDACNQLAPTCAEYVAQNPEAFADAYWDVRYIDAYQMNGLPNVEPTTSVESTHIESTAIASISSVDVAESAALASTTLESAATSVSIEFTTTTIMTWFSTTTMTVERAHPTSLVKAIPQEQSTLTTESSINATIVPYSSTPNVKAYAASPSAGNITYSVNATQVGSSATSATASSTQLMVNSTTEGFATIFVPRPTKMKYKANSTMATFTTSRIPLSTELASEPASKPALKSATNLSKIGGFSYLGCFESDSSFQSFEKIAENKDMTAEYCINLCKGKAYAGVFDTQCFCADDIDGATQASKSNGTCGRSCPGDDTQFCGGVVKLHGNKFYSNSTATLHGTTATFGYMAHTTARSNSSRNAANIAASSGHAFISGHAIRSNETAQSTHTPCSNQTTHSSHTATLSSQATVEVKHSLSNRFTHVRRANAVTFALTVYRSDSKEQVPALKFKPDVVDTMSSSPCATSTHSSLQSNSSSNAHSAHGSHIPSYTSSPSNFTYIPMKWNVTTFATQYVTAPAVTSIRYVTVIPIPAHKAVKEVITTMMSVITEHCDCAENTPVTRTKAVVVTTTQECSETAAPAIEAKIALPASPMAYVPQITYKELVIPSEVPIAATIAATSEELISTPSDIPVIILSEVPVIPYRAPVSAPYEEPEVVPVETMSVEEPVAVPADVPSVSTTQLYVPTNLPSNFSLILSHSMAPSPPPQPSQTMIAAASSFGDVSRSIVLGLVVLTILLGMM